jgi:two-component system chemotaxis sensor kinase CheA
MFEAGVSTASEITAISGRGVGMDVVRANIERIGGLVEIESRLGHGVRFTIRVPLTLTIIPALTVTAAGQVFAIPRAAIEEILRAGGASVRVERLGDSRVAIIRGRRVPLVSLAGLLGTADEPDKAQTLIILKPAGGDVYALALDAVHDHEELVVKPAAPAVMAVGLYAGTTLADDGRPVLLLDPSGMAAKAGVQAEEVEPPQSAAAASAAQDSEEVPYLLFHDLGGARRAVRLAVVERIEDIAADSVRLTAGRLRVVIGDRILPLAGCTAVPGGDKLRILRLSDGAGEIAYAFRDVIDILPVSGIRGAAAETGEVAGVALVGDDQVELLNPYWLFATHGVQHEAIERPICAMPLGDPWMENMLRPLVESLGYQVVPATEGGAADLLIASAEAPPPAAVKGATILRLSATPAVADSIYRYDKEALLSALRQGAAGGANG